MKYISGEELAEIIKSSRKPNKDYLIVDVRDDDFVGGNIRHAINKPSGNFRAIVDELVKSTKNVPLVIFHCAYSQIRGPKAAHDYEEARHDLLDTSLDEQEIVVLRGGFSVFQSKFKDDPQLVENWNQDIWASDWC